MTSQRGDAKMKIKRLQNYIYDKSSKGRYKNGDEATTKDIYIYDKPKGRYKNEAEASGYI